MGSFEGKIGLSPGGGSGIGRAVVERLAQEGARVVVADIDEERGTEVADSVEGAFVRTDVARLDDNRAAVGEAVARYGGLHLVHLNAGVSTGESDLASLSEDAYRRAVGANVDGVVFGLKAAAPEMREGGAIIATASLAGLVPYPGDPIYGLTKHAVIGFVRAARRQLEAEALASTRCAPASSTRHPRAVCRRVRPRIPLLQPSDVADAFVTVAGSEHTGQVFICQPDACASSTSSAESRARGWKRFGQARRSPCV